MYNHFGLLDKNVIAGPSWKIARGEREREREREREIDLTSFKIQNMNAVLLYADGEYAVNIRLESTLQHSSVQLQALIGPAVSM